MEPDPVTAASSTTLEKLVEDYVYRYQFKLFPVVDKGNQLLGCVTIKIIKGIPRKDWSRKTVGEIVLGCSPDNTIDSRADAMEALSLMNRTGSSRIMVTEENRLVGILSLKDMLSFLDLKVDLEP
jgi:CBS domain-containing protein